MNEISSLLWRVTLGKPYHVCGFLLLSEQSWGKCPLPTVVHWHTRRLAQRRGHEMMWFQYDSISPIFNKSWLKTQGQVYVNGHTKVQPAPGWDLKQRSKASEVELEQVKASGQASSTLTLLATVLTESKLTRCMENVNPWSPVGEVLATVAFIKMQVLL